IRPPPRSTPFPYTTLFRSQVRARDGGGGLHDRSRPRRRPAAGPWRGAVGHPGATPQRPDDFLLHEDAVRLRSGIRLGRAAGRLGSAHRFRIHQGQHLGSRLQRWPPGGTVMNKQMTAADVVGQLRDGMTIGFGGWGPRRKPMAIVREILRSDVKDLTVV